MVHVCPHYRPSSSRVFGASFVQAKTTISNQIIFLRLAELSACAGILPGLRVRQGQERLLGEAPDISATNTSTIAYQA